MSENSKIEWTDHTFNPWWGCEKVSQACKHCYAEAWAKRWGADVWGPGSARRFFSDAHWLHPVKWDRKAALADGRSRVFCASMADVFEDRRDLDVWRARLWSLVADTPCLDWLLLTKRPEHVGGMVPWGMDWPANVWLGATAEDQHCADERIPYLMEQPAAIRFVSCEPLLGAIDLGAWTGLDWVIAGGESGPKSRPMNPVWARSLRDQCVEHGISFFFKQWGKKAAGRCLEGRHWDQVPGKRRI